MYKQLLLRQAWMGLIMLFTSLITATAQDVSFVGEYYSGACTDVVTYRDYMLATQNNRVIVDQLTHPLDSTETTYFEARETIQMMEVMDSLLVIVYAAGDDGYQNSNLSIYDLSNTLSPTETAFVTLEGIGNIQLTDTLLYVSQESQLSIIDVRDISTPEIVNTLDISPSRWGSFVISDTVGYFTTLSGGEGYDKGLLALDISNTNQLDTISFTDIDESGKVLVQDSTLFIIYGDDSYCGISVYNVRNPNQILFEYDTTLTTTWATIRDAKLSEDLIFVSFSGQKSLSIFSYQNNQIIEEFSLNGGDNIRTFSIDDEILFAAKGDGYGIYQIESQNSLSHITDKRTRWRFNEPRYGMGNFVHNNTLFVSDNDESSVGPAIVAFDVSNLSNIRYLGNFQTYYRKYIRQTESFYITNSSSNFVSYNQLPPPNMAALDTLNINNLTDNFVVIGDTIVGAWPRFTKYIIDSSGAFSLHEATDDIRYATLKIKGDMDLSYILRRKYHRDSSPRYTYEIANSDIRDLSNISDLDSLHIISTDENFDSYGLEIMGDYGFIFIENDLFVFSILNQQNLFMIDTVSYPSRIESVRLDSVYFYVTTRGNGVHINSYSIHPYIPLDECVVSDPPDIVDVNVMREGVVLFSRESGLYTIENSLPHHSQHGQSVGRWHFDEGFGATVYDSSGYGNNGNAINPNWIEGVYGSAIELSDTSYVTFPYSPILQPIEAISVECIFLSEIVSGTQTLLGIGGDSSGYSIEIDNGLIKAILTIDSTVVELTSASLVTVNSWNHVALNYDGFQIILFLNQVAIDSVFSGGPISYFDSTPLHVGFEGAVDEIIISNWAKSPQEFLPFEYVSVENNFRPHVFALYNNYPNPFNPTTTISYSLPETTNVKMIVFNIRGQEVITLQNELKASGNYTVQWNGLDSNGNSVSAGLYFCRLQAGVYNETIKMLYMR